MSFLPKRVRRAKSQARRSVRPVLECLEDRNLLSGVPFTVNVPANAGNSGQYIDFTVYGKLESGYTPQSGNPLAAGTYVYLADTNGNYDWAAVPTSPLPPSSPPIQNAVPYLANVNAVTGGKLTFTIPSGAYLSGDVMMGIGTQSSPFTLYDLQSSPSSAIIPRPTPNPSGSPSYSGSIYDFAEFTYDDGGLVNNVTTPELDTDVTEEDQVGLTYTLKTTGVNGTGAPESSTVGITQTTANLAALFNKYMENTPFAVLDQVNSNRILSPDDYLQYYASNPGNQQDYNALSSYFNTPLNAFFTAFSQPNSFTLDYNANENFTGSTTTSTLGPWYYVTSATYDSATNLVSMTVQAPKGMTFNPNAFANGDSATIAGFAAPYNGSFTISGHTSTANTITFSYTPGSTPPPNDPPTPGPDSVAWDTTPNTLGGVTYNVLQVSMTNSSGTTVFSGLDVYNPAAAEIPGWVAVSGRPTESPGQMVFAQDSVFNSPGSDPAIPAADSGYISDLENAISSAINRGIATTIAPSDWASSIASFYPSGGTYNEYAAFLHQNSTTNPSTGISINPLCAPSLSVPCLDIYGCYW